MKRRINKKNLIVIIIILFISIGFAYLSTTLNISGITNIKSNNWNIYYDNIQYIRGQEFELVSPTTSGTNTTNISYTINLLEPGDVYKFNVDIVNGGTIDAMVKVVTDTALTEEQKKYASYFVTYNDGISVEDYQLLPHGETDTLSVMVAYKKDITEEELPSEDKSITIKFHLEYEQASSTATERNHITVVNRADESKLSVGDELAIDTEHFYVLNTDNEKTILFSKYNLDVETDINTIKQKNDKKTSPVAFSNTNYWHDSTTNNVLSKYGTGYPDNYVYDDDYLESSGNNYSLAYYVKEYQKTLETFSMYVEKSRIISLEELLNVGCVEVIYIDTYKCNSAPSNIDFLFTTFYWIGSASSENTIYRMQSTKIFYGNNNYKYYQNDTYGIRAIIEIPSLDI